MEKSPRGEAAPFGAEFGRKTSTSIGAARGRPLWPGLTCRHRLARCASTAESSGSDGVGDGPAVCRAGRPSTIGRSPFRGDGRMASNRSNPVSG